MKAVIFELDGTLVQTEILKAKSYARAAVSLCPGFLEEREVVEAFKEVVGLSRHEVAKALLLRYKNRKRESDMSGKTSLFILGLDGGFGGNGGK